MRIRAALLLTALLLVLTGCGGSPDSSPASPSTTSAPRADTPAAAMESLLAALEDGDCAGVKDVVLDPSAVDCTSITESQGSFAAQGLDLDRVTYRTSEIVDDSATVTIDWGGDSPEESYDAQRLDGDWKIIFDSAA